jgi:hypothetical protein
VLVVEDPFAGSTNTRYLLAFSTKDEMEKWLMMLASRRGTAAALPDSKATVESDATVGVTHPSGTLWMLGQCVLPACTYFFL